jgi:hypothetical protein
MTKRTFQQILFELLILGLLSLIINFLIYSIFTRTFKFPDYKEKGTLPMYVGGIVLVCGLHLLFEVTGVNEKWCKAMY